MSEETRWKVTQKIHGCTIVFFVGYFEITFFNLKKLNKLTFETPHIYNKYSECHKYKNRKCTSNENFVENEEEDDS